MNKSKTKKAKQFFSGDGKRYICRECGKHMSSIGTLNTHIRATHERIKYPCEQCEYQATSKGNLEQDRMSVHEGM